MKAFAALLVLLALNGCTTFQSLPICKGKIHVDEQRNTYGIDSQGYTYQCRRG